MDPLCHRVGLAALEPPAGSDSTIELMSMCYQHTTAVGSPMDQFSAPRHQSEQRLDQLGTGLVMITRQVLDIGATLTPGGDFFSHCFLRIVETPRWSDVPAIDDIAD
jgi:hypothetical protein